MRAGVALTLGPPSETDRASPVRPRREDEYSNTFPLTSCVFPLTLCVFYAIIINVREISPQGRKVGVFMSDVIGFLVDYVREDMFSPGQETVGEILAGIAVAIGAAVAFAIFFSHAMGA